MGEGRDILRFLEEEKIPLNKKHPKIPEVKYFYVNRASCFKFDVIKFTCIAVNFKFHLWFRNFKLTSSFENFKFRTTMKSYS